MRVDVAEIGAPMASAAQRALMPVGAVAASMAEALPDGNVIFVASDEQRADAVAMALHIGIARLDAGPAAIALTPRAGAILPTVESPMEERGGRFVLAQRTESAGERLERVRSLPEEIAGAQG